jgi:hypothetical protein
MYKDYWRSVRPDARLAGPQNRATFGTQVVPRGQDVFDLEADVVLAAFGVLGQEAVDG